MSKPQSPQPWSIPLAVLDVPPDGARRHLVADAPVRAAVARHVGVPDITRLEADVVAVPHGADGLHVTGRVSATVGQTCVVTLEPMLSEVDEAIDLLFLRNPPERPPELDGEEEGGTFVDERIEALEGGTIDLGKIATEFLMLGIDPYPRRPGATFTPPPAEDTADGPFAALAALRKTPDGHGS